MRLLLDTHALLWWLDGGKRLPAVARRAVTQGATTAYVSAATAWEIAIKKALGKLDCPDDLAGALTASGFTPLPITLNHALAAGALPCHHEDPFDRMLVAQALLEGLCLVTGDPQLARYGVKVTWG